MFQASNAKGRQFLKLFDNNLYPIEPSYSKEGLWLKFFSHFNSLCAKAIINHAPIEEYHLRFFPQEEFKCLCRQYPIKTRQYILYKYRRFNNYWNLIWDTIVHFMLFLEFNNNTFSFGKSIT